MKQLFYFDRVHFLLFFSEAFSVLCLYGLMLMLMLNTPTSLITYCLKLFISEWWVQSLFNL